jgi:phosphate/sulfate permease
MPDMTIVNRLCGCMLLIVCAFPGFATAATKDMAAYLDPGTGSIIIQLIIAGIVGGGFALKLFWYNSKKFFLSLLGKKSDDAEKKTIANPDITVGTDSDEKADR